MFKGINIGRSHRRVNKKHMQAFCETYNLKNLIKQPTCYKNPNSPTCIDLILPNVPRSFQSYGVVETKTAGYPSVDFDCHKDIF